MLSRMMTYWQKICHVYKKKSGGGAVGFGWWSGVVGGWGIWGNTEVLFSTFCNSYFPPKLGSTASTVHLPVAVNSILW